MSCVALLFLFSLGLIATYCQVCSEAWVLAEGSNMVLDQSPRLRRDWVDISATEKTAFLNALLSLDQSGWLAQFQCWHLSETRAPQQDAIHQTSIFLLWHRIFLWHIETKLMQYGIPGLPYWSFEYNAVDPKTAGVFTQDAFGPTGNGCADLSQSLLNGLNLSQSVYDGATCVPRNPDNSQMADASSGALYDDTYMSGVETNSQTYNDMDYGFGGPHASYHNYWGDGSFMLGMGSPRDPVFWLFHTNIDRHLTNWQTNFPSATYPGPEQTLSRYSVSPQTSLNPKSLNVQYQPPNPNNQALRRLSSAVSGATSSLSSVTGSKRSACLDQFSSGFFVPPSPASDVFKSYLSPPGAPKNSFRLFLDTMGPGYDQLSDDDLCSSAAQNIQFDANLDWYVQMGSLYENFDACTSGGLQKLGAKISEPGVLMTNLLFALKHQDDTRGQLSQLPLMFSRSVDTTEDASCLGDLAQAGHELTSLMIGLVGAQTNYASTSGKRNIANVPASWTCDPVKYNHSDGCDCGCGAPDPDCQDQKRPGTFTKEPVPIFGCPSSMSNLDCVAGVCVSGGAPPAEWKCQPGDYNTTNGCDCNCGVYDPDCRTVFPPKYRKLAPHLYGVAGCSNGIKPRCGKDGKCLYTREVPQAWKCPNVNYGSGDGCHCGCGAFDPDCKNPTQAVHGCACPGMTCSNEIGHCTGKCGGYSIVVRAEGATDGTTTSSPSSSSSDLSGGAIAGIVIGSVVGVALVIALIAFVVKRSSSGQHYNSVMQ